MTLRTCDREPTVLAAHRAGVLDEPTRAHLHHCAACALALEAERALAETAEAYGRQARLAPAPTLLLRARLRARREETERSLRPLELWQRFAGVAVAAGLAAAAIVFGPMFGALGSAPAGASPTRALFALAVASLLALPFARRFRFSA
jgi:hypothetical protein